MTTPRFQQTSDGQEVQQSDLALLATEGSRAPDYLLSDLLRLAPFNGSAVSKAIIPTGSYGSNSATVQPNGASGSVLLMPFTAIAGSRVAVGSASTDVVDGGTVLNWRDLRAGVFAVSDNNTTLGHAVGFTANSSGNPRWDLVYAILQCEQNGPLVTRFVRAPGAGTGVATSGLVGTIVQNLSVSVVTGTPGASPSQPALPADTLGNAGTYNIPIAYVQVPTGFSGSSVVTASQIQTVAPVVPIASVLGMTSLGVPTGLSTALPAATLQAWGATGTRSPSALPSTMTGGREIQFGIDARTSGPVLVDAAILDTSIDWRNRCFTVEVFASNTATQFAWQHGAASGAIPFANGNGTYNTAQTKQWGQSYVDDSPTRLGVSSRNAGVVFYANNASLGAVAAGSNSIGLYVDLSTGNLRVYYQGTPGCMLVFWIKATGAFDNV